MTTTLAGSIATVARQPAKKKSPLWEGPCGTGPQGGVTQSMISKWLACRERARLYLIDGLRAVDSFSPRVEYGNMFHACEESFAKTGRWKDALEAYARQLLAKHPMQRSDVEHWYMACAAQFPVYADFWSRHPDIVSRTPLMQEQVFDVKYEMLSGRVVRLRGKWDGVDKIGEGKVARIVLNEHKTKSQVDEQRIKRQLTRDMQSMVYIVALDAEKENSFWRRANKAWRSLPLTGVKYNVVRRPLSGGKGTIVQKQPTEGSKCPACKGYGSRVCRGVEENPCSKCGGRGRVNPQPGETRDEYYERVAAYMREEPETYFFRWEISVLLVDILKFRRECLDPILEMMADDHEWWTACCDKPSLSVYDGEARRKLFPKHCHRHFLMPYGGYSTMAEDRTGDYDALVSEGNGAGLTRVETLFRELT